MSDSFFIHDSEDLHQERASWSEINNNTQSHSSLKKKKKIQCIHKLQLLLEH